MFTRSIKTFLRNKDNESINYAHVDTISIFYFIEDILGRPRNNPIHTFERFADIEFWLREQWAGLFRELLHRQSQQQQLIALAAQVTGLKEINETLKKYLEALMTGVSRDVSTKLIASEEKRLEEVRKIEMLKSNSAIRFLNVRGVPFDTALSALKNADSLEEFAILTSEGTELPDQIVRFIQRTFENVTPARESLNYARQILGLDPFDEVGRTGSEELSAHSVGTRRSRRRQEAKVNGPDSAGSADR